MPVALLHLAAQVSHQTNLVQVMNHPQGGPHAGSRTVITPADMERVNALLEQATAIPERAEAKGDMSAPGRYITSDELNASFGRIPGAHASVINLSDAAGPEAVAAQLEALIGTVRSAKPGQVTVAPLFVNDHFMLAAVETLVNEGKYRLTVVNTHQPDDQMDGGDLTAAFPVKYADALRRILSASPFGNILETVFLSSPAQKNTVNSCGPLAAMLAEQLDSAQVESRFSVRAQVEQCFVRWHALEAQQQLDLVTAQRARMIGDAAEASNWDNSRFLPTR
jgi:hypothetical protein